MSRSPGAEPGAPRPADANEAGHADDAADEAVRRAADVARTLVARLADSLGAGLVETHISWVLLGAHDAWKLKKPLRLPFIDYGSLARRRACCLAEVALNRRHAPDLYLGVQAIVGTADAPRLVDDGSPESNGAIEYTVHMRRFVDEALWSHRLASGRLTTEDVDALARWLADTHAKARRLPSDDVAMALLATPPSRRNAAMAALDGARTWIGAHEADRLQAWLEASAASLATLWSQRRREGRVRDCHGDLHLANLLMHEGRVQAFDGIEFDPALRWIDMVDDLAFP